MIDGYEFLCVFIRNAHTDRVICVVRTVFKEIVNTLDNLWHYKLGCSNKITIKIYKYVAYAYAYYHVHFSEKRNSTTISSSSSVLHKCTVIKHKQYKLK